MLNTIRTTGKVPPKEVILMQGVSPNLSSTLTALKKPDLKAAKSAFEDYFTEKGLERFKLRAAYFAPKVGVKIQGIKVKEMGFRWASCGVNAVLNIHWKCMMAPAKIIDYIVVHELCHLHQTNHSDAFWNEIDKILPDYKERKDWLRNYGASLNI